MKKMMKKNIRISEYLKNRDGEYYLDYDEVIPREELADKLVDLNSYFEDIGAPFQLTVDTFTPESMAAPVCLNYDKGAVHVKFTFCPTDDRAHIGLPNTSWTKKKLFLARRKCAC